MLNTHEHDLLKKADKVNWTIWAASIGLLISLPAVALWLDVRVIEGLNETLKYALFFPSLIIPFALTHARKTMSRIDPDKPLAQGPEQAFEAALDHYRRMSVVSMALAGVVGLNGFVIYFVTKDFTLFITSIILVLVLFLYLRPSRSDLQDVARAHRDHPRLQDKHSQT